ncbi:c-type cytochrome [Sphingobium boeckii]|uniref:Cytochrome c n=1 Tax=Sphingobium boeckii TaxID=1082345 RepID=A0A7W9AG65_9SPHN|nr:c-type cytochrome [Sphingobium boeckii]MBB5684927.1 cytochrome c [Sphingobium boeckii]
MNGLNLTILGAIGLAGVTALGAGLPGKARAQAQPNGALVWAQCSACHSLAAGAPQKLGPNLNGIIGKRAGAVPKYNYSPALKASNIVWTEAAMDQWLTRPAAMVRGSKMAFIGISDPAKRKALIQYLKRGQ